MVKNAGVCPGDVGRLFSSVLLLPEDFVAVPVAHEVKSSVYQCHKHLSRS
jgi:hypothetical protein